MSSETDYAGRCPHCGRESDLRPLHGGEAFCGCVRGDVPSPCTQVCELDADTQTCRGCARTLQEITEWPDYDVEQKRAVLRRIQSRRAP